MITIILWLKNIAHGIGYWSRLILNEMLKAAMTFWGVVVLVAGLVYTAMVDTVGAINTALGYLNGMSTWNEGLGHGGGTVAWLLSVCNTFTPMDELFAYAATYMILMGAVGLYHLVKSWIPTLGG